MKTEFEATFRNIKKDQIRNKLNSLGGKLIKKEFLMKRCTYKLPKGNEIEGGWLRVRDEEDKITMALKVAKANLRIEDQKELEFEIGDYNNACQFLVAIGCKKKSYQETKREIWKLDNVQITIDEWPFLEPFIEIEGNSKDEVKKISKKLGFDYNKAYFGPVDTLYAEKYKISKDKINNYTPLIVFDMENPFIDIF